MFIGNGAVSTMLLIYFFLFKEIKILENLSNSRDFHQKNCTTYNTWGKNNETVNNF